VIGRGAELVQCVTADGDDVRPTILADLALAPFLSHNPVRLVVTVTSVHDPSHREALWELERRLRGRRSDKPLRPLYGQLRGRRRLRPRRRRPAARVKARRRPRPHRRRGAPAGQLAAAGIGTPRRGARGTTSRTLDQKQPRRDADGPLFRHPPALCDGGHRRRDLALHGSEEDLRTRILERPELVEPGFEPRETDRAPPPAPARWTCSASTPTVTRSSSS